MDQLAEAGVLGVAHGVSSPRSLRWERRAAAPREAWLLTAPRVMPSVVGDLGLGQVEVVAQREHLALAVGQPPQRVEYGRPAGRPRSAAPSAPVADPSRRPLRAACRCDHGAVPQRRAGAVDDRLAQVGQRPVGVAEPPPAAVHRDEGVLHDLLGGALVADAAAPPSRTSERQCAAYSCSSASSASQRTTPRGSRGAASIATAMGHHASCTREAAREVYPRAPTTSRDPRHYSDRMSAPDPDCLFCKIVAGDIPADVVHATDAVVAFRDLAPQAPTHVLRRPARPLRRTPPRWPPEAPRRGRRAGRRRRRGRRRPTGSTATTGWSSTPAPAPGRASSTPTCTCSAGAR